MRERGEARGKRAATRIEDPTIKGREHWRRRSETAKRSDLGVEKTKWDVGRGGGRIATNTSLPPGFEPH